MHQQIAIDRTDTRTFVAGGLLLLVGPLAAAAAVLLSGPLGFVRVVIALALLLLWARCAGRVLLLVDRIEFVHGTLRVRRLFTRQVREYAPGTLVRAATVLSRGESGTTPDATESEGAPLAPGAYRLEFSAGYPVMFTTYSFPGVGHLVEDLCADPEARMRFPERIGSWLRWSVMVFDQDGYREVIAAYGRNEEAAITVYLYDSRGEVVGSGLSPAVWKHFEMCKHQILETPLAGVVEGATATLKDETRLRSAAAPDRVGWHRARYEFETPAPAPAPPPAGRSESVLYVTGQRGFFVKVRATWPVGGEVTSEAVDRFVAELDRSLDRSAGEVGSRGGGESGR